MGRFSRLGNELYTGERSIDFVGRQRRLVRHLGRHHRRSPILGALRPRAQLRHRVPRRRRSTRSACRPVEATQDNADKLRDAVAGTGIPDADAAVVVTTAGDELDPGPDRAARPPAESDQVTGDDRSETVGVTEAADLSVDEIGASWGKEVAKRPLIGLIVFLILVVLFIWAYFRQWKMSVAAMVALAHDLVITVGIYALSGFEVTPATVIGLLTILGFSLYDTVVVFDKVRENTKNLASQPHDLRRGGQPRGQPDPGAVDQHLDRGAAPGRRDPRTSAPCSSARAR